MNDPDFGFDLNESRTRSICAPELTAVTKATSTTETIIRSFPVGGVCLLINLRIGLKTHLFHKSFHSQSSYFFMDLDLSGHWCLFVSVSYF